MISVLNAVYDKFYLIWENNSSVKNRSALLVFVFIVTLLIAFLNSFHLFQSLKQLGNIEYTDAIVFSFNFLLFFEMVSLVVTIPSSISSSIAKQFQIMSLIFLRTSFEELSNFDLQQITQDHTDIIVKMAAESSAALVIFFLTFWFYKLQLHKKIADDTEREKFISLKKIIALSVLLGLWVIVFLDFIHYLNSGYFHPSYPQFYLILIFADMLLMLAAFRYITHYPNIFRYSAYVLITIFIRIALMSPAYLNVVIGIATVLFGILTAYVHNLYIQKIKPTT